MWRWLVVALTGCSFHGQTLVDDGGPGGTGREVGIGIDTGVAVDAGIDADLTPIPITFVQGTSQTNSNTMSASLAYTSAQQAGDLNVVVIGCSDTVMRFQSVTDSAGNTYTQAGSFTTASPFSQQIFYAPNIHPGANTITVAFSSVANKPELRIAEYAGLALVDPVDAAIAGAGSSTTTVSGDATTTNAHDLIFGANTVASQSNNPGPMFTKRMTVDGDLIEDREVHTAGPYSAVAPQTLSVTFLMQMVAFKGAR